MTWLSLTLRQSFVGLTFLIAAWAASACESRAFFIVPQDGRLKFELISGQAANSTQEFGLGTPATTSTVSQRQYLFIATFLNNTVSSVFPERVVDAGFFSAGTKLDFYQRSTFIDLQWAFTSRLATAPAFTDLEAFTDRDNSLGLGGGIIRLPRANNWQFYIDSAGSADDDDNDLVIRMTLHPVPEPHSGLMATGMLACLAGWRRLTARRRRA